jgi:hypothetical protein
MDEFWTKATGLFSTVLDYESAIYEFAVCTRVVVTSFIDDADLHLAFNFLCLNRGKSQRMKQVSAIVCVENLGGLIIIPPNAEIPWIINQRGKIEFLDIQWLSLIQCTLNSCPGDA